MTNEMKEAQDIRSLTVAWDCGTPPLRWRSRVVRVARDS